MTLDLENVYDQLFSYCKNEEFAGYDPFDGLNSWFFQMTPLIYLAPARLSWLQMVKRSSTDLRPVLRVPKGVNPKGLALFALAEISRFRVTNNEEHAENAKDLLDRLTNAKIVGKTKVGRQTTAFGYNFDWQSRAFYVPQGTPAIVPTAFASQAYVEAYQAFGDEKYLSAAEEICSFILNDLNRPVETDDEVCFSYTPVDKGVIFNASLLAGESLARVGAITGNHEFLALAGKTVRFVVRRQRDDGAWAYGGNAVQGWVDNFHTAYILLSLHRISSLIPDLRSETDAAIGKGIEFWLTNFFLDDGTPKYFDKSVYPVDIHSAAAAIAILSELTPLDTRMLPMAKKTTDWTIANMRDADGYFYYQMRKSSVVKIPFMRWGQAWMAYALAKLIETSFRVPTLTGTASVASAD
ncbi:exopolysaccharide biosynthesis protein VpsJ [soil metagenome]